MSEEIIKVLDYISDKLGVAIDWTTKNALPYVEEVIGRFVTYNIVKHSLLIACGLILLFVFFKMIASVKKSKLKCEQTQKSTFLYWYSSLNKKAMQDDVAFTFFSIACVVLGLVATALVLSNIGDLMQWSIIPEMALLEEIKVSLG